MSGSFVSDNGVCDFRAYMVETSTEKVHHNHLGYKPECLADFIKAWVQNGRGVRACIGDWQVFTITLIAIISDWTKDPHLDYVTDDDEIIERCPESVFGDHDLDHDILDPHFFATWTFRTLQRQL